MGASTDTNNELTSGTVQTVSMNGYYIQSNAGSIGLYDGIRTPSTIISYFSFDSLNSYPQIPPDFEEGGIITR